MVVRKFGVGLVAISLVAAVAACGGSDSDSRDRHVVAAGKQQCLSDEQSTVDADGLATLTFCDTTVTYTVVSADGSESQAMQVDTNHQATYKATSDLDTVRIKSFDANNVLIGEDQVTVRMSCAAGAACKIGDTGPGGGIIAYDAGAGGQDWGRYIEVARRGWQTGSTTSSNPSDDPTGAFGCDFQQAGTLSDVGSGHVNMKLLLSRCEESESRLASLVMTFNESELSPVNDWVIPTLGDLWQVNHAPVQVLDSLALPRGLMATSSEDPMYRDVQAFCYNFYVQGDEPLQYRDLGLDPESAKFCKISKNYGMGARVRPVRYVTPEGAGSAVISIIGQMDIPTPPTTVAPTSTTLAPDGTPAPTGIEIFSVMGETLVVSWLPDPTADSTSTVQVVVSARGETDAIVKATSATGTWIPFTQFTPNVEYTFVVQRVNTKTGETANAEPVSFVPVFSLDDSGTSGAPDATTTSVEASPTTMTQNTMSADEPTTTSVNESTTTSVKMDRDCSTAPSVSVSPGGDLTSDDLVTFRIEHPCMGHLEDGENQAVMFGRVVETENGLQYVAQPSSYGLEPQVTSMERSRHFAPGTYSYMFNFQLWDDKTAKNLVSESTVVTVTIGEGGANVVDPCDDSGLSFAKSTLTFRCQDINASALHRSDGEYFTPDYSDDGNSVSFDLSKAGDGWKQYLLIAHSGADSYALDTFICVSECDVPSKFSTWGVTIDGSTATIKNPPECSDSFTMVHQTRQVNGNLLVSILTDWITGSGDVSLFDGADALWLTVSRFGPPCTDDAEHHEWAVLGRETTKETQEIVRTPVVLDIAQVNGGATNAPAGEASAMPLAVASEANVAVLTPAAAESLYSMTVDGEAVSLVELSLDSGKTWVRLPKSGGRLPLKTTSDSVRFKLSTADGTSAVIVHEIERVVTKYVKSEDVVTPASGGGSGVSITAWVLLALVLLLAAALAVSRRKPRTQA